MAGTTKRAWKLQEFVAHGSNVTCLALGHKSGRVMVTGGDDKKVNMWAVGKPNCIMSLTGHTSPIQAVRFGHAEEMVVAGSLSGALKIWDLEAAKIVRTLTGHKCSIKSLDFHPQGDFVASGSVDTNIKLWDIRRKGCIFTYKGHTGCVNSIRFSPDARWIASASDDGLLKMWDLTAGKLLTDFRHHTGPVTSVEFHPNEFLLATGSEDRTVKFMDLESFKLVSSSEPENSGIRSIAFHPEGLCLYAAMTDKLKVYSWEPTTCYDSLTMDWGPVADIAIAQKQLIGATFSNVNVSTHVVDVQRVQPLGGPPYTAEPSVAPTPSPPKSASGRRSFVLDRPHTQATGRGGNIEVPAEQPSEDVTTPADDPSDDMTSFADIQDPDNYKEVFKPRSKIGHSPTRPVEPFPAPQDEVTDNPAPVSTRPPVTSSRPQPSPAQSSRPPTSSSRPASQGTARPSSIQTSRPSSNQNARPISGSPKGPRPTPTLSPTKDPPTEAPSQKANNVPSNRNKPVDLNMDDFLPKQQQPIVDRKKTPTDISETEAVSSIVKGHGYMNKVLMSRHKNLQIVRALWTSGNTRTALDSAMSMNDLPVIVDLMNVLLQKPGLMSLDLSATILPQVDDLLQSKYENYAETGCAVVKLVLKNFSHLIKANITAPPSIGVDISREERYNKCKQCYKSLMTIRSSVDKKSTTGKLGPQYRELQLLMSQLD